MKKSSDELNRVEIEDFKHLEKLNLSVALNNVRSFNNVGSVFRTADAFKIKKIILGGISPTPPHRDIHKTALGAELSMEWQHETDLLSFLQKEKEKGVIIISLEQCHNSVEMHAIWPQIQDKHCILVIGNEVNGVDADIIELSDFVLEIPQFGTKHSLNVSVSAGICMHDYCRQMTTMN